MFHTLQISEPDLRLCVCARCASETDHSKKFCICSEYFDMKMHLKRADSANMTKNGNINALDQTYTRNILKEILPCNYSVATR